MTPCLPPLSGDSLRGTGLDHVTRFYDNWYGFGFKIELSRKANKKYHSYWSHFCFHFTRYVGVCHTIGFYSVDSHIVFLCLAMGIPLISLIMGNFRAHTFLLPKIKIYLLWFSIEKPHHLKLQFLHWLILDWVFFSIISMFLVLEICF